MLQNANTDGTPIFSCRASDFFAYEFRSYVFGYEVYLRTDNETLSFLGECALTANCIARWNIEIQECNLHIQHITGAEDFLADTISLNLADFCEGDTKEFFKPKEMVVSAINIGAD